MNDLNFDKMIKYNHVDGAKPLPPIANIEDITSMLLHWVPYTGTGINKFAAEHLTGLFGLAKEHLYPLNCSITTVCSNETHDTSLAIDFFFGHQNDLRSLPIFRLEYIPNRLKAIDHTDEALSEIVTKVAVAKIMMSIRGTKEINGNDTVNERNVADYLTGHLPIYLMQDYCYQAMANYCVSEKAANTTRYNDIVDFEFKSYADPDLFTSTIHLNGVSIRLSVLTENIELGKFNEHCRKMGYGTFSISKSAIHVGNAVMSLKGSTDEQQPD